MQAICLIGTKNPDGTKGFSLVAILQFELGNPYPLGMGFFLEGFGGLFAMNRTFDEVAYSDRPGTSDGYHLIREVAVGLRTARENVFVNRRARI